MVVDVRKSDRGLFYDIHTHRMDKKYPTHFKTVKDVNDTVLLCHIVKDRCMI